MKEVRKLNIALICAIMLAGGQMSCSEGEAENQQDTIITQSPENNESQGKIARFRAWVKDRYNYHTRRGPVADMSQENNGQAAEQMNRLSNQSLKDAYEQAIYKTDAQGNFVKQDGSRVYPANGDPQVEDTSKINLKDETGNTVLHQFAKASGTYVDTLSRDGYVKNLLDKNANPNIKNNDGNTPLHEAIKAGNFEIVKHLITAGADLNIRDELGQTPLMVAAKAGNLEMVKALLAAKDKNGYPANVYAKDTTDKTALHHAVENGNPEIVKELLASGSFINAQDEIGDTPLHWAYEKLMMSLSSDFDRNSVSSDNENIVNLINARAKENIKNGLGQFAGKFLSLRAGALDFDPKATFSNQKGMATNIGIDPQTKKTPLMRAIQSGDEPLVRALIAQGADVNAKDIDGNTALHYLNSTENNLQNKNIGLSQETRNSIGNSLMDAGANKEAKNKAGVKAKNAKPTESYSRAV